MSSSAAPRHPALEALLATLGSASVPFVLLVECAIKPGFEPELRKFVAAAQKGTRREPGAIAYEIHQGADDTNRLIVFEKWRSFADLEQHFAQDYTIAVLTKLEEWSAEPVKLRVLRPYEPASINADGGAVKT